jgi:hypothetical protein
MIHIMDVLNTHYKSLISTKRAASLLQELDYDYSFIRGFTPDMYTVLIKKGIIINGVGNVIPSHLYPLRLVFHRQTPDVQESVKAFLRFYQQLTKFNVKPTKTGL